MFRQRLFAICFICALWGCENPNEEDNQIPLPNLHDVSDFDTQTDIDDLDTQTDTPQHDTAEHDTVDSDSNHEDTPSEDITEPDADPPNEDEHLPTHETVFGQMIDVDSIQENGTRFYPSYCLPDHTLPNQPTTPLPETCDPETDPNQPCLIDVLTYRDPPVCGDASDDCLIDAYSYVSSLQTCPNSQRIQRRISNNDILSVVYAPPGEPYIDTLDAQGRLSIRHIPQEDPQNTPENLQGYIYYTYYEDGTLQAWVHILLDQGMVLEKHRAEFDRNATMRVWTQIDYSNLGSNDLEQIIFSPNGTLLRQTLTSPINPFDFGTQITWYECRGYPVSSRILDHFEPTYDRRSYNYDGFGRLVRFSDSNSQFVTNKYLTYARNPPDIVEHPVCP